MKAIWLLNNGYYHPPPLPVSVYRIRPSKVTVLVSHVRAKYNIRLKTDS